MRQRGKQPLNTALNAGKAQSGTRKEGATPLVLSACAPRRGSHSEGVHNVEPLHVRIVMGR